LDPSTGSLSVLYATHLPDSRPSFSPLIESDRFLVAYGSHIQIYALSGIVGSLSMQSLFSSPITAIACTSTCGLGSLPQDSTTTFLVATREDGVFLIDLLMQDPSSIEFHSARRLREHVCEEPLAPSTPWHDLDDLPPKYSPLLPFYTHLVPLLSLSSKELSKFLVLGSHRSIGSQMVALEADDDHRNRDRLRGLNRFTSGDNVLLFRKARFSSSASREFLDGSF
jgi:hypothetical protein